MNAEMSMRQANVLQPELQSWRQWLHSHPGTGFQIADTVEYVKERHLCPQRHALAGGSKLRDRRIKRINESAADRTTFCYKDEKKHLISRNQVLF